MCWTAEALKYIPSETFYVFIWNIFINLDSKVSEVVMILNLNIRMIYVFPHTLFHGDIMQN